MAKENYQDRFSGPTKALLRISTNIFLDSGLDVRQKHMFGHVAFVINGNMFLLVGEWPRQANGVLVCPGRKGLVTTTAILPTICEEDEQDLMARDGSGFFAPDWTRLKSWVSLSGPWLLCEEEWSPVLNRQLERFSKLPPKRLRHSGLSV